jgi:hypothetical protein
MSAIGIGLLILAHMADYLTFLVMVTRHGMSAELNPLVVTLAEEHGLLVLTVAKVAAVVLAASSVLIVARTRPRLAGSVLVIAVALGGLGAWSNIVSI